MALRLPKMRELELLTLIWRSFSRWGRECVALALPIEEANTSVKTICNQCLLWLPRMQDLKLLTLCWRSFPSRGMERLSTYFDYKGGHNIQNEHGCTIIDIGWLKVGYLNAIRNRTTPNAMQEIGPNGSNQTRQNVRVDGYRARFGPARSIGSGCWTVLAPNWKVFAVQALTTGRLLRPIANTIPSGAKHLGHSPVSENSLDLNMVCPIEWCGQWQ